MLFSTSVSEGWPGGPRNGLEAEAALWQSRGSSAVPPRLFPSPLLAVALLCVETPFLGEPINLTHSLFLRQDNVQREIPCRLLKRHPWLSLANWSAKTKQNMTYIGPTFPDGFSVFATFDRSEKTGFLTAALVVKKEKYGNRLPFIGGQKRTFGSLLVHAPRKLG